MISINLKRVYDKPASSDGVRILVERLWPRGISKEAAKVDLWLKDAAPSKELRQWFHHDTEKWDEFKERYSAELDSKPDALTPITKLLGSEIVTFVFATKDIEHNSAYALKEYILKLHA